MTAEEIVKSEYLYRGRVVTLRLDDVQLLDGKSARREIVEHAPAVAIVAVDADNVLLVRQYRLAAERVLLEVPAGVLNPGEDPADGARRELREETGYAAGAVVSLGGFYSAPGFCTEFIHIFLATGLQPGAAAPEADETIETIWVPIQRVPDLIREQEIGDAKSVAGLLRYLLDRQTRR